VTGDADATQSQAARVMATMDGGMQHGPGLGLLMQRMVGAFGLSS